MTNIIFILTLIFIFCLFLAFIYKKCPSNRVMIKFCPLNKKFIKSIPEVKGTFIIPFLQDYIIVPEGLNTTKIEIKNALTKDNYKINVSFIISYEFCLKENLIQNAINNKTFFYTNNILKKMKTFTLNKIELIVKNSFLNELKEENTLLGKVNNDLSKKFNLYGIELKENILVELKII